MTTPSSSGSTINPGGFTGSNSSSTSGAATLNSGGNLGNSATKTISSNTSSDANIGLTVNPPAMQTLVYSPDVRVVIAHGLKQFDVSTDIVRCSLHRAEDSAASFFMTLANKDLRYTPTSGKPPFSRMDRIVVFMKRANMIQVFSGYLDSVPYKQLYPGTVDFKATCTIKRLMYTWWNPSLDQSSALLEQSLQPGMSGDGQQPTDGGMGSMLQDILVKVGGWNVGNIHIQNFPTVFYDFLRAQATSMQADIDKRTQQFGTMLEGSGYAPGVGAAAGTNPNSGPPGPVVTGGTPGYVQAIIAACDARGMGPVTSDNNQNAGIAQAGATLSGDKDQAAQKAGQQLNQVALNQQQANRNSDAAILGVATAAVETGGGVAIRNLSNPAVPGSDQFTSDGPGYDHTSIGIMQQQNNWGSIAQRMNPQQAAGMFFDALAKKAPGWRNEDPGACCQAVQVSAAPDKYDTAMSWATAQVLAARQAAAGTSSTTAGLGSAVGSSIPGIGVGAAGAAGAAAPSTNPNLTVGTPSISPAGVGTAAGLGIKPIPDSEGAVQFMLSKCGNTPYVWGGKGPASYDCSGLVSAAFASIGKSVPSQTDAIRSSVPQIPKSEAGRGDIYEPESGHVTVLLGPPGTTVVSARTDSVPLPQQIATQAWYSEAGFEWYGRVADNGGADASSPYNPTPIAGGGTPPGAGDQQAGATGTGSSGETEPIAHNLFSYMFTGQFANQTADYFTGELAFVDGQPLLQMVKAIAGASLRKFQSAPNGDLMFYYPDWWGLDGKPAVFSLHDIELKDVRIDLSDDPMTTHVYVAGDFTEMGQNQGANGWLDTAGIVTVEDAWIYQRLIQVAPGDPETLTGQALMQRYGIRPLQQNYAMAGSHELEFLLACQIFMEKWAQQYQTSISMTFMPELYPGMRVTLADGHNLSVYVTEVTHVCDFENGFSTQATIMAPASPNAKAKMQDVLASAGLTNSQANLAFTDPLGGSTTTAPGGG